MRNPTSGGAAAVDLHGYVQMDATRGGTRYYMAGEIVAYSTMAPFTCVLTADTAYAMPLLFARRTTLVGLHIQVTGAVGGSSAQLGIYDAINDTSDLYPNTLIVDAGSVSTAANGFKSAVIATTLTGGKLYWLVCVPSAQITLQTAWWGSFWPILGWTNTLAGYGGIGWQATLAFGALPGTFPTAGSTVNTGLMPGLYYSMA